MSEVLSIKRNRHPVDELGDVREKLRQLEERDDDLREMILRKECSPHGDDYVASVEKRDIERLDKKAVMSELGKAALRKFLKRTETMFVTVKRRG